MHVPDLAPVPAPASGLRLPSGRALSDADFAWRHRVVCAVLAVHLPFLLVLGLLHERSALAAVAGVLVVATLLLVARSPLRRRWTSLSATTGLLLCSTLLVHDFGGLTEVHFHYFVAVAVVALYQDWRVFAAAIGFVLVDHGLTGWLAPQEMDTHGHSPWLTAAVHAGFVLAESSVLVVFWYAEEQARERQDRLAAELHEGDQSVQARLAATDRMRSDLIATVSHEFRTPLTGIRGAALTLLKRGDRLDREGRESLLRAVLEQQEKLSRLLENMLIAAAATKPDREVVTDVHAVATEVAMLAGAEHPSAPKVAVLVEPDAVARIERQALHSVLANLVDNAQVHGAPGSVPLITGGRDERGVWVAVSNDGSSMDQEKADDLFKPFSNADNSLTRSAEGLGVGLYVVRRLVEVHGGTVDVRTEDGWVTVEVRLAAEDGAPAAVDVPVHDATHVGAA
jgi:signal transduction histidine kinase